MNNDFRLLMIGAMYENGGNVTQRLLDGHPQLFVYPFESQLGARQVVDPLSSMFPIKYRWPQFPLDGTPYDDYKAIIDEECKVRARTPQVSKFRHMPFDFSDDNRERIYERMIQESGRSRAHNVAAFFRATFEAWHDHRRGAQAAVYVGYSPILVVDADKILTDFPQAHFLHVVRNPWSAYADTKKRPVPQSLRDYMLCWTINQYYALLFKDRFPDRMHILRLEDIVEHPLNTLGAVCEAMGLDPALSLQTPSWNGIELDEVYPWGTIRKATPESNRATADELSEAERAEVRAHAWRYLDALHYTDFLKT